MNQLYGWADLVEAVDFYKVVDDGLQLYRVVDYFTHLFGNHFQYRVKLSNQSHLVEH